MRFPLSLGILYPRRIERKRLQGVAGFLREHVTEIPMPEWLGPDLALIQSLKKFFLYRGGIAHLRSHFRSVSGISSSNARMVRSIRREAVASGFDLKGQPLNGSVHPYSAAAKSPASQGRIRAMATQHRTA
jgi:hypothetical protein